MSDNLLREVDEEVRRENLKKLWDRYGIYAIGVAVLIVAGTAGYRGWEAWQAKKSAESGDQFLTAVTALEDDKSDEARDILETLRTSGSGDYSTLARFRAAALEAENGNRDAAISAFEAIAADSKVETILRDLATLRAAHLSLSVSSYDDIKTRVEPLARAGAPWRTFAREILGLSAYKAGDTDAARTWYEALVADAQAPQNARGRADLVLSVLGGSPGAGGDASAETTETE